MMKGTRHISQLRNLGKQTLKDFEAVGITHAHQLITLGPEKAFLKMLEGRKRRNAKGACINALYLYAI